VRAWDDAGAGVAVCGRCCHGEHERQHCHLFPRPSHAHRAAGGAGVITLRADPPLKAVLLETHSGTFSYQYNPTTREWHEPHTGDDLRGTLTRDLLAHRKGSPRWK
jgi:hypothetical protein